jgi:hypothetical protein
MIDCYTKLTRSRNKVNIYSYLSVEILDYASYTAVINSWYASSQGYGFHLYNEMAARLAHIDGSDGSGGGADFSVSLSAISVPE